MAALLGNPTMTNLFSSTPDRLPPTFEDPTGLWLNPLNISQSDKGSLIQSLNEQKASSENHLRANPEYKPQPHLARKTRRSSKPYISRHDVSPGRARHLERNRVAANKCRMKKKEEHKQIQSVLDSETAKHEALLAQVNVLKEEIWHLKNQIFEHATKCDDQQINLQLPLMPQKVLGANSNVVPCLSPTFSASTRSDGSVGDGDSGGVESGALEDVADAAPVDYPDGLFDSFIDVLNM
ncbi:hypothetical protein N7474_003700 [Penicillium riverlandense]|uniref:uncharacterized protein n=1 Tax=Penicillium riverlandense TaxID=1903569 RepID=UPI0025490380|nr:uncharacterized protein N7474_003700 [Penicillium riverlandense]KAJ5818109.1 hypothetical protein N7474_003700 [Penicillium riverlandense]